MLTLVVGGSASGKSAFAERLAVQSGLPRFYVATMRVWDAESEKRVARHRAMRREKRFETLECPLHLEKLDMPARGTALLEDMGNLAANELYDADGAKADAVSAILRGADRLRAQCAHLIIVSNEVFRGRGGLCGRYGRVSAGAGADQQRAGGAGGERLPRCLRHTQMGEGRKRA